MNVLISDELLNGTVTNQFEIQLEADHLTVAELITKRVTIEIENYNKRLPAYFNGLVEPKEAERTLNGFKLKAKQLIDVEKQVYIALNAFQKNGFFVLVDNEQLEELDQVVMLKSTSKIAFVKLTPLIGG
jgi:glutaredoxin 2